MKVFQLAVMFALSVPAVACSRKADPPAQPSAPENPKTETTSEPETIENGLVVIRTRYPSAIKYTPESAAKLVEEYEKLQQEDPAHGVKKFWDKHNMQTVFEVEGTLDLVGATTDKDNQGREYMRVHMRILSAAWEPSNAAGVQPRKVEAQIVHASQTALSLKQGQKVIVRGVVASFDGSEDEHPSGTVVLFTCQLVSPKDE